jgi:hypothetical protein
MRSASTTVSQIKGGLTRAVKAEAQAYAHGEERPLGSYAAILATYGTLVSALAGYLAVSKRRLPERIAPSDLALLTVATHKFARLVAKDPVTSPLRAAFTRYSGTSGEAEVAEDVRGRGPRKAVGEMVTCPFCLGQWTATVAVFGLIVAPRSTRLTASVFAMLAGSDVLQFLYDKLQQEA